MATQGERIVKLETNFKTMFDQNAKEHKDIKNGLERLEDKMDAFILSAEKKFAPIWVKQILVWSGGIIGSFLILYVLSKLFIK